MATCHWASPPPGCFICSMESGVQVYNVEPLAEKGTIGKREMDLDLIQACSVTVEPLLTEFELTGGVVYADMLGRTNLIALVGGGQAPKFPDRNGERS